MMMSAEATLRFCVWVTLGLCGLGGSRKDTDVPFVLHGGPANQGFSKSLSDANLMYEFLLGGLMIDADDNVYLLDHELASMRQGRAFIAYFNDNVPKTLIGMERLLTSVEARKKVLDPLRFETLVLGAVYSAYQMRRQTSEDVQQAWGGVLARLANTTLHDLRTNAISN
ncbi:protein FAM180A [Scleropages formosus]|uniref:protein FAM180A n=1 Tax=Scleropages formosus TaxID=113540 RepID=UPI0010FA6E36|nr:protein FAM180A-like [Scleropages formosus]